MILVGKTQNQIDQDANKQALKEEMNTLLKYLADTDWYVIRAQEESKIVPEEVSSARSSARVRISEIRS